MAGYSETPLIKKLGIKSEFRVALVKAPKNFKSELGPLPANAKYTSSASEAVDIILFFVQSQQELATQFAPLTVNLSRSGMIWVAWPKKSSGVVTDLSFDKVQQTGLDAGLVDVKICAIDEIWSGLKFVYRLKDRGPR